MTRTATGSGDYSSYGRTSQYESQFSAQGSSSSVTTEYCNAPRRPQQPAPRQPAPRQPAPQGSAPADAQPPVIIVRRPEGHAQPQAPAQAPVANNQQQNPIQAPIFNNAQPQPIIINNAAAPAAAPAPAPQPIIINNPGGGGGGWGPGPGYDNNAYSVVTRRTLQTYGNQGYYSGGYDPNAYAQPYDPNMYAQHPAYDPYAGYGYDAAAYGQAYGAGYDPAIVRINPATGQQQAPAAPKKSSWSPLRILSGLVMVGGAFTFGVAALGLASQGAPINAFGIAPAPWGNWSDMNGAWAPLLFGATTAIAGFFGFKHKPA